MKRYRLLYIIACVASMLLSSCREPQPTHLKIVCTGDVHGHLFPQDFLTGDSARGSLARVSSYLKALREQGTSVVYLDNGDMLQGTPATYYYNTRAIGSSHVAAEALNYLGCDVVALGNNDIETGGATYQRYINDLNAQVVGGNILFEGSESPLLRPFASVEREGLTIAVLGLTTPAIPHWIPKCQWPELEFVDMEQSARRWMHYLDENVKPDLIVGLFHSGYEGGIVTDDYTENATRVVAERVLGFDAIFYGHDHRPRVDHVVNGVGDTVWIINPGKHAHQVATIDVVLDKEGISVQNASLVDVDNCTLDGEYLNTFSSHIERINKYLDRTIGKSSHAASTREALFGPSSLVDFIHQMQLDISGAQISFAAPLTYDYTFPEGEVQVRDIFDLFPYENFLYVLWLTGREIKDYLEMSYSRWTAQMISPNDHLLLLDSAGERLQHPSLFFDSAAGIIYEVDVTKPVGHRVSIKRMANGDAFRMDARYVVAMNSYRAHGGGGLISQGAGLTHEQMLKRIEYTTTTDLRFYMLNYIEMRKTIAPQSLKQWKFVPERWTMPAGKRDSKLLFGEE